MTAPRARWFNILAARADDTHVDGARYRSMMSSSDAIIWNIEADPHLRSTVMSVWELDSVPTPERMNANIERMVAAIPRLRQRVEDGRPRPTWVDTDVELDRHYVVRHLAENSTFDDALAEAQRWVGEPFDRNAPLWQLGLLTGLAGGRAAAVIKVHHSIADGMGMVLMLGAFTDLERDPPAQPTPTNVTELPVVRRPWSAIRRTGVRFASGGRALVRAPFRTSRDAARTVRSAIRLVTPNRTPCSQLMTERSGDLRLDARAIPLPDVKAAGRACGATVNDVFVSIATDAIRRYHWRSGSRCERLRVHMPVNSRNPRTAGVVGNEFVPARVVLQAPSGSTSVPDIGRQLEQLRDEPALHHINTVSATIQRLGRPISRWIIGGMMKGVDVLASNVPGPPFPLYLAGSKVERFVAFGPPAGAALNITAFSYDGDLHFGITTDAASVTDRRLFLTCLDESIAELVDRHRPALAV